MYSISSALGWGALKQSKASLGEKREKKGEEKGGKGRGKQGQGFGSAGCGVQSRKTRAPCRRSLIRCHPKSKTPLRGGGEMGRIHPKRGLRVGAVVGQRCCGVSIDVGSALMWGQH